MKSSFRGLSTSAARVAAGFTVRCGDCRSPALRRWRKSDMKDMVEVIVKINNHQEELIHV